MEIWGAHIITPRISRNDFRYLEIRDTDRALKCGGDILVWKSEEDRLKKGVRLICEKYKPESVLEIGFGLGYTASEFQKCGVKYHTIIEAHTVIYKNAVEWRSRYPDKYIRIVEGFFQDYKTDEKFDVFYDDRKYFVYEDDEFAGAKAPLRKWLKSFCNEGGIVAGYARDPKFLQSLPFDNGFFFKIDGTEYRQPLMVNVWLMYLQNMVLLV